MLGLNHQRRYLRTSVAVWLALLFSFSSLAPLAAQSLNSSPSGMACCRTKGKSCCQKSQAHHSDGKPTVSARNCNNDCGGIPFGVAAIHAFVLVRAASWVPAIAIVASRHPDHVFPASTFDS